MANGFVIASSAFLFIPTFISFFRQSLIVTIILLNSAIFSTLYHLSDEKDYETFDLIWASLAILIGLLLLAALARKYPPWNWRIFMPFALSTAAFVIYFVEGSASTTEDTDSSHYDLWHSLWHLLIGLAGLFLVWTPVNLADANISYADLYVNLYKNSTHSKLDKFTLLE
jgi:uncharacterized membrane protein YfcA